MGRYSIQTAFKFGNEYNKKRTAPSALLQYMGNDQRIKLAVVLRSNTKSERERMKKLHDKILNLLINEGYKTIE